jgi:hypothetical protein
MTHLIRFQLCNKCGLFERTHSISRPKEFPRRRRSRPPSARQSADLTPLGSEGHYYHNSPPSNTPFISHLPNDFCTVGGPPTPQDVSWTTHDIPYVSSTPSLGHLIPSHSTLELPRIDFQPLSTVPTTGTSTPYPSWDSLPTHVNEY